MRGTVSFGTLDSRALQGNALGDPTRREVLLYLPPSYDGMRRFPLLMVLPPYAGTHRGLTNDKLWEPNFFDHLEQCFGLGAPECIVVCPDAITRLAGSQFVDGSATGNYQSFLVDDVLPWVDANARTLPHRQARAVVGRSSGGFGALRLAIDRPEAFLAFGSHAGDALFEVSLRPLFATAAVTLDANQGVEAFVGRVLQTGPAKNGDFETLMTLATVRAYAKRNATWHDLLPFNAYGEVIDERWREQCEADPVQRLAKKSVAKDAVFFLDAGNRDEHALQMGARKVRDALRAQSVLVEHQEFDGGHRGTASRFLQSIPWLLGRVATT